MVSTEQYTDADFLTDEVHDYGCKINVSTNAFALKNYSRLKKINTVKNFNAGKNYAKQRCQQ